MTRETWVFENIDVHRTMCVTAFMGANHELFERKPKCSCGTEMAVWTADEYRCPKLRWWNFMAHDPPTWRNAPSVEQRMALTAALADMLRRWEVQHRKWIANPNGPVESP